MDSVKRHKDKTCHDCGVEAFDQCENDGQHIPYDEEKAPCKFCERNLKSERIASDFYSQNWILDANKKPTFDDMGKREECLLELLEHAIKLFED
jgi:hypothetical protein